MDNVQDVVSSAYYWSFHSLGVLHIDRSWFSRKIRLLLSYNVTARNIYTDTGGLCQHWGVSVLDDILYSLSGLILINRPCQEHPLFTMLWRAKVYTCCICRKDWALLFEILSHSPSVLLLLVCIIVSGFLFPWDVYILIIRDNGACVYLCL